MKNMRKVLVSSLIMILTCCLFFAGTTFAWFSDSVTSNNNIITAGTLDIELEASYDGQAWFDVNEDTEILSASDLWEPGFTKVVYFKVKNMGSLDLKYSFNVSIVMENAATNVYGEEFKLSDYLKYGSSSANEDFVALTNRDAYVAASANKLASKNVLANAVKLEAADVHYGWLAITMPTSVGNEANTMPGTAAPSLQIGFNLLASQVNSEEDSFGPDYDENANGGEANVPVAAVEKAAELEELNASNVLYIDSFADLLVKGEDAQPLETQYGFYATETPAEAVNSYYRYWHADFVIEFDREVPAGAAAIAGQYGNEWTGDSWIVVSNKNDVIPANTELRLLDMLLGATINYEELSKITEGFHCGAYDINNQLAGTTLKVELRLYETYTEEECLELFGYKSTNEEKGADQYIVIGSYEHTFQALTYNVKNSAELAAALDTIHTDSSNWNQEVVINMAPGQYAGDFAVYQYPEWDRVSGAGHVALPNVTNITFVAMGEAVFTGNVHVYGYGNSNSGYAGANGSTKFVNVKFDAANSADEANAEDSVVFYASAAANNLVFNGCTFENASHVSLGGSNPNGVGYVEFNACVFNDGGALSSGYSELVVKNCVVNEAYNGFINASRASQITVEGCEILTGKYFLRTSNTNVHVTVKDSSITVYESEGACDLVKFRGSNESLTFVNSTVSGGALTGVDADSTVSGLE